MSKDTQFTSETLLEDGSGVEFHGATLRMHPDSYHGRNASPSSFAEDSDSVAKLSLSPELSSGNKEKEDDSLKPAVSSGADVVSPIASLPKRISQKLKELGSQRKDVACQLPVLGEDEARHFFSSRSGLVAAAVEECVSQLVVPEVDGQLVGSWLLTEISLWDNEKERLVLLTTQALFTVKYDFIALQQLEFRRVSLSLVDALVIGELVYPSGSLSPSRNTRGVRVLWNHSQPLGLGKKWNPFNKDIPFTTFTSHPLFWQKEASSDWNCRFDVDDFAQSLMAHVEKACDCRIEHKPVLLENYVGIGSLIHNRNSLGFFKIRGKFSF